MNKWWLLLILGVLVFMGGLIIATNPMSNSREEVPVNVKVLGNLDHLSSGKYPKQKLYIIGINLINGKTIDIEVSPSTYYTLSKDVGGIYTFNLERYDAGLPLNYWGNHYGWAMLLGICIAILGVVLVIWAANKIKIED